MRKVLFILGQLSDSDADWLTRHGQRQRIASGTTLIRHGTRISTVYIILEGAFDVRSGRGLPLAVVGSGDILGEMSLVDPGLTAASVIATQDSLVLAVSRQQLADQLQSDIGFAARFYRALALFLADRMRNTIGRLGYEANPEAAALDVTATPADADELDDNVLDTLHLAGARFERMLKTLAG